MHSLYMYNYVYLIQSMFYISIFQLSFMTLNLFNKPRCLVSSSVIQFFMCDVIEYSSPYLTDLGLSSPDPSRLLPGTLLHSFCGCRPLCVAVEAQPLVRGYRLWTLVSSLLCRQCPSERWVHVSLKINFSASLQSGLPHSWSLVSACEPATVAFSMAALSSLHS